MTRQDKTAEIILVIFTVSDFCVIAAVNDDDILRQCLELSPEIASGASRLTSPRRSAMARSTRSNRPELDADLASRSQSVVAAVGGA
ncbi:MAG: hypothetical protein CVT75_08220 [Alphaproteobacteria bacterium HGW-Alphaproteobacteria-14]|nr:MAG: hypothetical protein CVT75_08220 [Alphaproteobacteria bacterium HGW-Alphaproteobacteria-14]